MADDWDLSAVVRSCGAVAAAADTSTSFSSSDHNENPLSCLATLTFEEDNEGSFGSHSPATCIATPATGPFGELESLCRSFLRSVPDTSWGSSPLVASVPQLTVPIPAWDNPMVPVSQPTLNPQHQPQRQESEPLILPAVRLPASNSKSKKRKSQPKSVCHFTGETLSSDPWAWRKYGQKPIKGSPYPRSYYRCSSSKACMARKQVERSSNDPEIFIVMYTGEHSHPLPTHRNSLAGSTRNKFLSLSNSPQKKSTPTLASDNTDLSPATPLPSPGFEDTANSENNDDTITSMMDEDDDMAAYHWLIPNEGMSEETLVEYPQAVADAPGPNLTGLGLFSSGHGHFEEMSRSSPS